MIGQATNKAIQQEVDCFLGPSFKPFYHVQSGFLLKPAGHWRCSDYADFPPAKRQRAHVVTSKVADDSDNMMAGMAGRDTSPTLYHSVHGGYISTPLNPVLDYDESSPQH